MLKKICFLIILALSAQINCSYAGSSEQQVFEDIAKELLPQFEKSTSSWSVSLQGAMGFGVAPLGKSIAVWPFNPQEIPVPANIARRWSRMLEAEIVRNRESTTRVVTRKALKTLIAERQSISAFEQIENPTAKLAKNAEVSALAIGEIRPEGEDYYISYQVIGVQSGTILAATREYRLSVDVADASRTERLMPLDTALKVAIEHFADANLPIENLELDAVRDSRTKAVTDFGNFVTETFSHGYADLLAFRLPEFRLRVSAIEEQAPTNTRFTTYRSKEPARILPNQYRFEGSYWRLGNHMDLRLSLTNPEGERVAWSGKIDIRSIPVGLLDHMSQPPRFGGSFRDKGPIGLKISTNKGRNPSYKIGERMVIWVETQEDAYLNCFYKQADGVGFKIYPNRFLSKAPISQSERLGWIKGGEAVEIPGSNANFAFDIQPPEGREDIHCFATDREVSAELPRAIGAFDLEPIRQRDLNNLSNYFRDLRDVRISESQTTVSISR